MFVKKKEKNFLVGEFIFIEIFLFCKLLFLNLNSNLVF